MDENAVGTCAELIFAPIDASFPDDAPLPPSGFHIIPLESSKEASSPNHTVDLTSALETGSAESKVVSDLNCWDVKIHYDSCFSICLRKPHARECCINGPKVCPKLYLICSEGCVSTFCLSPSHFGPLGGFRLPLGTPEAHAVAGWICQSYRRYLGVELLKLSSEGSELILERLWHHSDAIICCSAKALPVFTFANQVGVDMLETTLVALRYISLEKIFDEHGSKNLCSEFPQIMQQGSAFLRGGICLSSMGRSVSYEKAVVGRF